MPSVDDWINNPLGIVEGIFAQGTGSPDWEKKVLDYFKDKMEENVSRTWVPSLNDVPLHYLKPNGLVRFRCLVQDMFAPEFYMGVYETVDPTTESKALKCGKYKDVTECAPVDFNSRKAVTSERQTFYCVPIPGESAWVKEISFIQARVVPSTSYTPNRQKRSFEEDEEMDSQPQRQRETNAGGDRRRQERGARSSAASPVSSPLDLNFPLPGEQGPACLVKVYEGFESYKVNDTLEVFGIFSFTLVPIIRTVRLRYPVTHVTGRHRPRSSTTTHCCPLLPRRRGVPVGERLLFFPGTKTCRFLSSFLSELDSVRSELLKYLTHVLLGDALAAEYLLLHLISTVYARRDVLPLGKFALNLSGCPHSCPYTERLYQILQQLVTSSYRLGMSLANMNGARLVPRKDYVANRLVSGALQLPSNACLFLDETQLEQGQLDATGVRNITALGNVISWQKVDYDFSYHQMEFPCNINVLVTSEARSLLPSDCRVHLQPQLTPPDLEEYLGAVQAAQLPSQLNKYRTYLSVARELDYNIAEEVTKAVEDDFVDMRKDDPQSISAEDLHRLLVVSRLLSLSFGQTSLSRDTWLRAKNLEMVRMNRIQQQKCANGNEP
uniref:Mini-chromosome maintenance complex-binding protein n=1 Tax=Denticeps clupeoides TaxID=299321 RepID=A0AAY4C751_9TELE